MLNKLSSKQYKKFEKKNEKKENFKSLLKCIIIRINRDLNK